MADHNRTGKLGERIAARYLCSHGFHVVERNYNKKWGEIDLVMWRKGEYRFIEVKTTTHGSENGVVPDPVEHMDDRKIARLSRAVQTWAIENNVSLETSRWQCDVCLVYLEPASKDADVQYIPNIALNGA